MLLNIFRELEQALVIVINLLSQLITRLVQSLLYLFKMLRDTVLIVPVALECA